MILLGRKVPSSFKNPCPGIKKLNHMRMRASQLNICYEHMVECLHVICIV